MSINYTFLLHTHTHIFTHVIYSNYILGETNTLIIDGVQSDNAGEYRCAYEIQEGLYLYSDYGELEYLGEGMHMYSVFHYTNMHNSYT